MKWRISAEGQFEELENKSTERHDRTVSVCLDFPGLCANIDCICGPEQIIKAREKTQHLNGASMGAVVTYTSICMLMTVLI